MLSFSLLVLPATTGYDQDRFLDKVIQTLTEDSLLLGPPPF